MCVFNAAVAVLPMLSLCTVSTTASTGPPAPDLIVNVPNSVGTAPIKLGSMLKLSQQLMFRDPLKDVSSP